MKQKALFFLGVALVGVLLGFTIFYIAPYSLCIPENTIINYVPQKQRNEMYIMSGTKPMPFWWQPQLNQTQMDRLRQSVNAVVARSSNELWLAASSASTGDFIFRYRTDTHDFKPYGISGLRGEKYYEAINLLVTKDGNLWVKFVSTIPRLEEFSLLAKYDPEKDEFRIVTDENGLLLPHYTKIGSALGYHSDLAESPNGELVIMLNGEVYTYNPQTNQARRVLGQEQGLNVNSVAVSQDGHIWFTTDKDLTVRELDPVSGTIWNYGIPPTGAKNDRASALAIDKNGRVWVLDYGWLEPNQESRYVWHSIKRSTIFIDTNDQEYEFVWRRPSAIRIFSSENVWYRSSIGMVQFNPQTGIWCKKATHYGLVTDDIRGDVWFISDIDGQIYKYIAP